jgi:hypothetical protein
VNLPTSKSSSCAELKKSEPLARFALLVLGLADGYGKGR